MYCLLFGGKKKVGSSGVNREVAAGSTQFNLVAW